MQPLLMPIAAAALLYSVNVVTGQGLTCNGQCVERWKKCAGEGIASGTIRPCCSEDDQCVEKTSSFSQCRPKSQDVPASWPSGAILTCTEPSECDPTVINLRLGGLSAARTFTASNINRGIELEFFYADELDYQLDTNCLGACQTNDDCFVFNESVDGDCTLFGKNLFTTEGNLQPFFDAEVFLTKCFLPEPLCDPATREVRQVNSIMAADGGPHQQDRNFEASSFFLAAPEYAITAGINACRLNNGDPGRCIGFAIEAPPPGRENTKVTLLYPPGRFTVDFEGVNPKVYNIEECT